MIVCRFTCQILEQPEMELGLVIRSKVDFIKNAQERHRLCGNVVEVETVSQYVHHCQKIFNKIFIQTVKIIENVIKGIY